MFFVISGFCIHLRWAKAKALGVEPDTKTFFHVPDSLLRTIFVAVLAPLSVLFSWVFFYFFEKPFMSAPETKTIALVKDANHTPPTMDA